MTDDETTVYLKTSPTPDGKRFVVTLEYSQDGALSFNRKTALQYAAYVYEAAALANYDAAVIRQLHSHLGIDQESVVGLVSDLRKDRPPQHHAWPLTLVPGVSQKTKEGFLTVSLTAEKRFLGQWSISAARNHAAAVVESVAVADLDAGYLRMLRGPVGLDENRARQVIDDLQNFHDPNPGAEA